MAFDEKLPKWDNVGVEPPESKKVEGWQPTEKPPAQWFNWIFNRIYKVVQELQNNAVEKETGKGLSSNDYTTTEKNKLADIEKGANKTIINDTLASTSTTEALSANMGRELFQNVSDGKQVVATAITGKGVPTSSSDTFQKMATNIGAIETDKTGDATAVASDILAPKTAYSKGNKLVGTMTNIGKQTGTITSNNGQVTINKGYHDGTGAIGALFANLIEGNVKSGINIGGVVGNFGGNVKIIPLHSNNYNNGSIVDVGFRVNYVLGIISNWKSQNYRHIFIYSNGETDTTIDNNFYRANSSGVEVIANPISNITDTQFTITPKIVDLGEFYIICIG